MSKTRLDTDKPEKLSFDYNDNPEKLEGILQAEYNNRSKSKEFLKIIEKLEASDKREKKLLEYFSMGLQLQRQLLRQKSRADVVDILNSALLKVEDTPEAINEFLLGTGWDFVTLQSYDENKNFILDNKILNLGNLKAEIQRSISYNVEQKELEELSSDFADNCTASSRNVYKRKEMAQTRLQLQKALKSCEFKQFDLSETDKLANQLRETRKSLELRVTVLKYANNSVEFLVKTLNALQSPGDVMLLADNWGGREFFSDNPDLDEAIKRMIALLQKVRNYTNNIQAIVNAEEKLDMLLPGIDVGEFRAIKDGLSRFNLDELDKVTRILDERLDNAPRKKFYSAWKSVTIFNSGNFISAEKPSSINTMDDFREALRYALKVYVKSTFNSFNLYFHDRAASVRRQIDIQVFDAIISDKSYTNIASLSLALKNQMNTIETGFFGRSTLRDNLDIVIKEAATQRKSAQNQQVQHRIESAHSGRNELSLLNDAHDILTGNPFYSYFRG